MNLLSVISKIIAPTKNSIKIDDGLHEFVAYRAVSRPLADLLLTYAKAELFETNHPCVFKIAKSTMPLNILKRVPQSLGDRKADHNGTTL